MFSAVIKLAAHAGGQCFLFYFVVYFMPKGMSV